MTTSSTPSPRSTSSSRATAARCATTLCSTAWPEAYGAKMVWPLEVRDGAVYGPSVPTAGPPPHSVYELVPEKVIGLPGIAGTKEGVGSKGSFTPTRWRFAG